MFCSCLDCQSLCFFFFFFFLLLLRSSILFTTQTPNMKVLWANSHNTEHLNTHSGFQCNKAARRYCSCSLSRSRNNQALLFYFLVLIVCIFFSFSFFLQQKISSTRHIGDVEWNRLSRLSLCSHSEIESAVLKHSWSALHKWFYRFFKRSQQLVPRCLPFRNWLFLVCWFLLFHRAETSSRRQPLRLWIPRRPHGNSFVSACFLSRSLTFCISFLAQKA